MKTRKQYIKVAKIAAAIALSVGVFSLAAMAAPTTVTATHPHVFFRVQAPASVSSPVSGRLLIFIKQGTGDKEVDIDEMHFSSTWVAAAEVNDLAPGATVEIDADNLAYPQGFSALAPGNYEAQAVLDVEHAYNYRGRRPSAWMSNVVMLAGWTPGQGAEPTLVLNEHPQVTADHAAAETQLMAAALPGVAEKVEATSGLLTNFWGHDVTIKAWVILPPGYTEQPKQRYPTVYWTHGFGGTIDSALASGMRMHERMSAGSVPPMIWVMLDESIAQGTHEFADSTNNGPWGAALTTEFIPLLESKYRMDAKPRGRLLNGHSSGGWATLQLQINYPKIFGGTWSTSPDPSDFHDFTGIDLYASNANVYRRADGSAYPIMRDSGKVLATFQEFAQLENVINPYGGQMSSFDWVFSPKSASGSPQPMFDRVSGAVDPQVLKYWRDHYDLANLVELRWPQIGRDLKGRIHVIVGTADTFYLDGAAHLFESRLLKIGAEPHFSYLLDKTHFDLYNQGAEKGALFNQITAEMYAVARPGQTWKSKAASGDPATAH